MAIRQTSAHGGAGGRPRGRSDAHHKANPHAKHHHKTRKHNAHKHKHRRRHPSLKAGAPGAPLPVAPAPPAPSNVPAPTLPQLASAANVHRLLWRAGFGPTSGQAEALAGQPVSQLVFALTRPTGQAKLSGPEPVDDEGHPLAPADAWGHDHCWWLDRMIRSDQQLVERMTFIWHDWFANSNEKVDSSR